MERCESDMLLVYTLQSTATLTFAFVLYNFVFGIFHYCCNDKKILKLKYNILIFNYQIKPDLSIQSLPISSQVFL